MAETVYLCNKYIKCMEFVDRQKEIGRIQKALKREKPQFILLTLCYVSTIAMSFPTVRS